MTTINANRLRTEERRNRNNERAVLTHGTADSCLPTVAISAPRSFPDRIFITRISPEVNVKTLLDYMLTRTKKVRSVTKLKSRVRNPVFASFVVELERGEGTIVNDPTKWSAGMAVREYRGRPHEEQIEDVIENEILPEDSAQEETVIAMRTGD